MQHSKEFGSFVEKRIASKFFVLVAKNNFSENKSNDRKPDELEFFTNDKFLLTGGQDSHLIAIDLASQKQIFDLLVRGETKSPLNCACFHSSNAFQFWIGNDVGDVDLIDIRNPTKSLSEFNFENSPILSMKQKDDKLFFSQGDGTVAVFDEKQNNITHQFTGSDCEPVYKLDIHDDKLFTACRDGVIRSYDLKITK